MATYTVGTTSLGNGSQTHMFNYTLGSWNFTASGGNYTGASRSFNVSLMGITGKATMSSGQAFKATYSIGGTSTGTKTLWTSSSNQTITWSSWASASVSISKTLSCTPNSVGWFYAATQSISGSASLGNSTSSMGSTTFSTIPSSGDVPSNFWGTPSMPTVNWSNIVQTSAYRTVTVGSFGNYGVGGSWQLQLGTSTSNYNIGGGSSTSGTISGLAANTTYFWRARAWNNRGVYSSWRTGSFTTPAWVAPTVSSPSLSSRTTSSLTFTYSTSGATVGQIRYRVNGGAWVTISGNPGSFTVSGLSPKTAYSVELQAHNSNGGWGNTTKGSGTTFPTAVTVTGASMSNLQPFSATANATSSASVDTSGFRFELWNAANTTQLQVRDYNVSSSWNITGLTPETTYTLRVYAKTNTSNAVSAVRTITFTTPADQASIFVRVGGTWRRGKVWVRTSGVWQPAKKVFVRVSGTWRENTNN